MTSQTPIIDTSKTAATSLIDETTISTTPILGRKFEDLLTLTPGVSVVQGPDGDEITFAGQRGVFNNISLDGGDYNNGFFGEQVGGQRAAVDITLDAIKEFQVIANGASAEFGRTAGGVVNVITKSGTNDAKGSLFYHQRLEGLTSNTSDGKPLDDFHREQFGGTLGGPIKKNQIFFFGAYEGIQENLSRANLGDPIGTPCPVSNPTLGANEALINSNSDCQRVALINFFKASRNQDESLPVVHQVNNNALLGKLDWVLSTTNNLQLSYNFNYSDNLNQTFDVPTYGTSANGTEGPSKINIFNANLFTTLSPSRLNEFHITVSRESRPRSATESNIPADTGIGFAPSFRFGNPFFLAPNVDELVKRFQIKDNISVVTGRHTMKAGAEWLHTNNFQVFRGFFEGRYLFDSVSGFLRYTSPAAAGGFGPLTIGCSNGTYVTAPASCPAGTSTTGGPLLFYLQSSSPDGVARDAAGESDISNEEISLFAQDKWRLGNGLTVDYGLRWDAQLMPETVDPKTTAFAPFLTDPRFPSDGTIPSQKNQLQPRGGFAWDVHETGKTLVRGSAGIYYARQNMLSQVGSVTTNGIQQKSDFRSSGSTDMPVWPNLLPPTAVAPGTFPLFTGIRVFDRELPESAHLQLQYRRRAHAPPGPGGLCRLHRRQGGPPDAVPELQRPRHGRRRHAAGDARYDDVYGSESVRAAAWRRLRHDQLGTLVVSRRHLRPSQALLLALSGRRQLRHRQGRRRRFQRARPVHGSFVQLLRPEPGLRSVGSRHPAQGQRVRLRRVAVPPAGQHPDPGTNRAADHDVAARARRRRSRPQLGPQGQRLLLVRLAPAAAVHGRRDPGHSQHRDVQHVQQRQQHQPADDGGAVQLRRVPAAGRGRSAPGAAGGSRHVLSSTKQKNITTELTEESTEVTEPSWVSWRLCSLPCPPWCSFWLKPDTTTGVFFSRRDSGLARIEISMRVPLRRSGVNRQASADWAETLAHADEAESGPPRHGAGIETRSPV